MEIPLMPQEINENLGKKLKAYKVKGRCLDTLERHVCSGCHTWWQQAVIACRSPSLCRRRRRETLCTLQVAAVAACIASSLDCFSLFQQQELIWIYQLKKYLFGYIAVLHLQRERCKFAVILLQFIEQLIAQCFCLYLSISQMG